MEKDQNLPTEPPYMCNNSAVNYSAQTSLLTTKKIQQKARVRDRANLATKSE